MGAPSCPLCSTSHSACDCHIINPVAVASAKALHQKSALEEIVEFASKKRAMTIKALANDIEEIRRMAEDGLWV